MRVPVTLRAAMTFVVVFVGTEMGQIPVKGKGDDQIHPTLAKECQPPFHGGDIPYAGARDDHGAGVVEEGYYSGLHPLAWRHCGQA